MPSVGIITETELNPQQWEFDFIRRNFLSAGVSPTDIRWFTMDNIGPVNVLVPLGERCLQHITDKRGIDKWQCSVIPTLVGFESRKCVPCYDIARLNKEFSLQLWFKIAAQKAAKESLQPELHVPARRFLLNPGLEHTLQYLRETVAPASVISIDIETSWGIINTVGFSTSPDSAIAINTLPEKYNDQEFYELWSAIASIVESKTPKILQNFIFEQMYFSKYGIRLNEVHHDTMLAQKFLYPEYGMGLDVVGRMYTTRPYWKDDGKNWNNIKDWNRHYEYNCQDTSGTFEGFLGQRQTLSDRKLTEKYKSLVQSLCPAITEMCSRGIPVFEERLYTLRNETDSELKKLTANIGVISGIPDFNPKSPKQVKATLESRGYKIPTKYNAQTKNYQPSTDEKSLKKLRLKNPKDELIPLLLQHSKLSKAMSSYLSFTYDPDKRMRFSLNAHGTETGRFSGYADAWGHGVNPQTVPGGNKGINIKNVFRAEPGFVFLECDLRQAESRFVAYDSPDPILIKMLEDSSQDVHRYVAAGIFHIDQGLVTKQQRQLGKKSGHGANYAMKEATFMDSCIQEMDLVLSKSEANNILETYHRLFPGIRNWHRSIQAELRQTRKLTTPMGRERYFFGRFDDDMFRQAYAYRPQSTIPDIMNALMLFLISYRGANNMDFRLLLQCHDSLLLEVPEAEVNTVTELCHNTSLWHPKIELAGGTLVIPTETKSGPVWGELE